MPLDYRVTLDCGHTYTYRTTINPLMRERLVCGQCGTGQRAARAVLREPSHCEFHKFRARSAWSSRADNRADNRVTADGGVTTEEKSSPAA